MTTAIDVFDELRTLRPGGTLVQSGVDWETYERLLTECVQNSHVRIVYDEGELEALSPMLEHEEWNRILQDVVTIVCLEMRVPYRNCGSATFKFKKLRKGFEADTCFYIGNEAGIRGKSKIDLAVDPPPDVLIEVDVTSGSRHKFPLYASLGVPEIWRYAKRELHIYRLSGTEYVESEQSVALPLLTVARIMNVLETAESLGHAEALWSLQAWIRQ